MRKDDFIIGLSKFNKEHIGRWIPDGTDIEKSVDIYLQMAMAHKNDLAMFLKERHRKLLKCTTKDNGCWP